MILDPEQSLLSDNRQLSVDIKFLMLENQRRQLENQRLLDEMPGTRQGGRTPYERRRGVKTIKTGKRKQEILCFLLELCLRQCRIVLLLPPSDARRYALCACAGEWSSIADAAYAWSGDELTPRDPSERNELYAGYAGGASLSDSTYASETRSISASGKARAEADLYSEIEEGELQSMSV